MKIKKFKQLFEKLDTSEFDFDKTTYFKEFNTIVGAYMIIEDKEKYIKILNIRERDDRNSMWADNYRPYYIHISEVILPKSQIKVLSDVDGKEGFSWIEIPYWLYKKEKDKLFINRLEGKKKITVSDKETAERFSDPNIEKYFNVAIKYDEKDLRNFNSYKKYYSKKGEDK